MSCSSSPVTRSSDVLLEITNPSIAKLSYWPSEYSKSKIETIIKDWEGYTHLSLHVGNKTVRETSASVSAWGLRCDVCYAAKATTTAKANQPNQASLLSWASEHGCFTRKKPKWDIHRNNPAHQALVNVSKMNAVSSGVVAQGASTKARIDDAARALFRIVLYVAQKNRPISDVNDVRALHVLNGNVDLSLDPQVGVLSDPSANYTSTETLNDMLTIAAHIVNLETAGMLKNSPVFTLTLDESTDNGNVSQLLLYSNQMTPLRYDPDLTAPVSRLLACKEVSSCV